jgi:hypothetical protein
MERRQQRMYGLVPYNISPIQQAIQFGHAVVEYAQHYYNDSEYQSWAIHDKTFIILNGGTTNLENPGTLNCHEFEIEANEIKHANFFEPDLGSQLTAVVFLVDDRVWDKNKWPDYEMTLQEGLELDKMLKNSHDPQGDLEACLESFESYRIWFNRFSENYFEAGRIVWLRNFLKQFKLA